MGITIRRSRDHIPPHFEPPRTVVQTGVTRSPDFCQTDRDRGRDGDGDRDRDIQTDRDRGGPLFL